MLDRQFVIGRRLNREVGVLFALEDAINVARRAGAEPASRALDSEI
jgi:hypothetical protein